MTRESGAEAQKLWHILWHILWRILWLILWYIAWWLVSASDVGQSARRWLRLQANKPLRALIGQRHYCSTDQSPRYVPQNGSQIVSYNASAPVVTICFRSRAWINLHYCRPCIKILGNVYQRRLQLGWYSVITGVPSLVPHTPPEINRIVYFRLTVIIRMWWWAYCGTAEHVNW